MHVDALTLLWKNAKRRLKEAKFYEAEYRRLICQLAFTNVSKGINYSGELKLTQNFIYSLDRDKNKILDALAAITEQFPDLNLGELIEWNPKLNVSEYDALPNEARQLLSPVLTIKPAMPILALQGEKDTKNA